MADEISPILTTFLIYLALGVVLGVIGFIIHPLASLIIIVVVLFQWLNFYMMVVIPIRNGRDPSLIFLFLMSIIIMIPIAYWCYRIIDNSDLSSSMRVNNKREAEEYKKQYRKEKRDHAREVRNLDAVDSYISRKKDNQKDKKTRPKYGF